jgi:hypothetical protein
MNPPGFNLKPKLWVTSLLHPELLAKKENEAGLAEGVINTCILPDALFEIIYLHSLHGGQLGKTAFSLHGCPLHRSFPFSYTLGRHHMIDGLCFWWKSKLQQAIWGVVLPLRIANGPCSYGLPPLSQTLSAYRRIYSRKPLLVARISRVFCRLSSMCGLDDYNAETS